MWCENLILSFYVVYILQQILFAVFQVKLHFSCVYKNIIIINIYYLNTYFVII